MNIIPFTLVFLLVLSALNFLLFSSKLRTARMQEIVTTQHTTYLALMSEHHKRHCTPPKPARPTRTRTVSNPRPPAKERPYFREVRRGDTKSKLLLCPCVDSNAAPELRTMVRGCLYRLIQILYAEAPFYQGVDHDRFVQLLVEAMIQQKSTSWDTLRLSDPEADRTYYAMVRGTNTGYPSLTEYCALKGTGSKVAMFRYASAPVLRAILGDVVYERVAEQEVRQGRENSRLHALKKEELLSLLAQHPSPYVTIEALDKIFDYSSRARTQPQLLFSKKLRTHVSRHG